VGWRWLLLAIVVISLAAVGCSGGPSQFERQDARAESSPLPAAAQPPDPCALLRASEVSAAVGQTVRQRGTGTLANGADSDRLCFWDKGSGLAELSIETDAAERSARGLDATIAPMLVPEHTVTVADLYATPTRSVSIGGLGDQAKLTTFASGDLILEVLSGTTLIRLSTVLFGQVSQEADEHLGELTVERLSQSA
jgi:hypothetical protein